MEIKNYTKSDITILVFEGNLDGTTSEYAQESILGYIAPNCAIALDMSNCPYVSSAGLRVLMMTAKQLAKVGGKGVFAGLADEVKDVMEMTGFSSIFESYMSVEDAIDALGKE